MQSPVTVASFGGGGSYVNRRSDVRSKILFAELCDLCVIL